MPKRKREVTAAATFHEEADAQYQIVQAFKSKTSNQDEKGRKNVTAFIQKSKQNYLLAIEKYIKESAQRSGIQLAAHYENIVTATTNYLNLLDFQYSSIHGKQNYIFSSKFTDEISTDVNTANSYLLKLKTLLSSNEYKKAYHSMKIKDQAYSPAKYLKHCEALRQQLTALSHQLQSHKDINPIGEPNYLPPLPLLERKMQPDIKADEIHERVKYSEEDLAALSQPDHSLAKEAKENAKEDELVKKESMKKLRKAEALARKKGSFFWDDVASASSPPLSEHKKSRRR